MSCRRRRQARRPSAPSRRPRSARCCARAASASTRRGEPALDVEAEVARLLAPQERATRDPGIELEVRQLVIARNERRSRQGLEQLDVDAEVARTLEELGAIAPPLANGPTSRV